MTTDTATPTGGTATFVETPQPQAERLQDTNDSLVWNRSHPVVRQKAAVSQNYIVAFQWIQDGNVVPNNDYTWINTGTSSDLPFSPHIAGGKLLYDQLLTLHNGRENAPSVRIIERDVASGQRPTYRYGRRIRSGSNQVDTSASKRYHLDYDNLVLRRNKVAEYVAHEFAPTNWGGMDAILRVETAGGQNPDYRTLIWYSLGMNWLYAASFLGNRLDTPGADEPNAVDVNALIRGVTKWQFEDYHERISLNDVRSQQTLRNIRDGLSFYYLEQDSESNALRIRSTTAVRTAPNFCKWWARNLVFRHPTHLLQHMHSQQSHFSFGNY